MSRLLAAAFAAALLSVPAVRAAEFEYGKDRNGNVRYLWHEWVDIYKADWEACSEKLGYDERAALDWKKFEHRAAAWNDFAHIDQFSALPAGYIVKIPPSPCDAENGERAARLESERDAAVRAKESTEKEKDAEIRALRAELAALRAGSWIGDWRTATILVILLLAIGAAFAAAIALAKRRRTDSGDFVARREYDELMRDKSGIEMENLTLKNTNRTLTDELETKTFFLNKYAAPYKLPPGIGSFRGKSDTVYLQRAAPEGRQERVFVHDVPDPVHIDNVKEKLGRASDVTLDYYDIHRGETITGRITPLRETVRR